MEMETKNILTVCFYSYCGFESSCKKYSINDKECLKYKEEYDNHDTVKKYNSKKRKFTSSTLASGFLSKAVRETYPSLSKKSSESPEFKKALQVARSYQSYINHSKDGSSIEPANKKRKFRQAGGGRKPVAVEVNTSLNF